MDMSSLHHQNNNNDSETEESDHHFYAEQNHHHLLAGTVNHSHQVPHKPLSTTRKIMIGTIFLATIAITGVLLIMFLISKPSVEVDEHKLLMEFIDINSISGNEGRMGEAIYNWLDQQKWTVEKQWVTESTFNVLAYHGNRNPKLLVNSHMDTVPPFIPHLDEGDYIYGRGACDAKGAIVAQLFAVSEMLGEGTLDPLDVAFLYVVEEETTSGGMLKANELGLTPKYLLVGEPTEMKLAEGHKGGVSVLVESFGKESHSGYPELGHSAITPLAEFMIDLEKQVWPVDSFFGQSTMNIGKMSGGVAMNVVPAYANISVFVRTTVQASIIKEMIIDLAKPYNFTLTFNTQTDPFKCNLVPGFETEVFSFGTDLPAFHGSHKSYLYGPGSILVAHTDEEHISKAQLTSTIGEYKKLITAILDQEK